MRLLLFIGILTGILTTTTTVHTQERHTHTQNTYFSVKNGGIMCGIAHGAMKKALYQEPSHKKFTINASAYTAAADECGKSDGITASGKKVRENHTLACPRGYAFGTKIHIEGMGTYVCEDRGGAIKGNKFDIYMKTKAEAFAFGRRNLVAYVIS